MTKGYIFQTFVGGKLSKRLEVNLFAHMLRVENDAGVKSPRLVTPAGYIVCLSQFLKGTVLEKVQLLMGLAGAPVCITSQQIVEVNHY